jgi:hypothetical protein
MKITHSRTEEQVSVGLQIRELIQDIKSEHQLGEVENAAWK